MRYVLAAIGFIVGFVLLVVLIVTLRPSTTNTSQTKTASPKLADVASSNATTRLVTAGPINALENHREIRITINNSSRTVNVLDGYQGNILAQETFTNTTEAYQAFLAALDRSGFTIVKKSIYDTPAGLCPLGNRYTYELYDTPSNSPYRSFSHWSVSCSSIATFGGNGATTRTLFQAQIPNYQTFINGVPGASSLGS